MSTAAYQREWRRKHPDKVREYNNDGERKAHLKWLRGKEKKKEYRKTHRAWQRAHPDKCRIYNRRYRLKKRLEDGRITYQQYMELDEKLKQELLAVDECKQ